MGFLVFIFFIQILNFRRKKFLYIISTALIFITIVLSTPFVSSCLMNMISYNTVISNEDLRSAGAIVVLGGGIKDSAKEYDGIDLSTASLQRVRYASYLYNRSGLPILVSGGKLPGQSHSEASIIKKIMEDNFITPVKWMEEASIDTNDNAKFSHEILSKNKIQSIVLITHSWHMNRASILFEKMGFTVYRAPTDLQFVSKPTFMSFMPSAKAFHESSLALKELYGVLWYSL